MRTSTEENKMDRDLIEAQTEEYLRHGGLIEMVKTGIGGTYQTTTQKAKGKGRGIKIKEGV